MGITGSDHGNPLESEGREADGAGLMNTAFSPNNPIIKFAELDSETGPCVSTSNRATCKYFQEQ